MFQIGHGLVDRRLRATVHDDRRARRPKATRGGKPDTSRRTAHDGDLARQIDLHGDTSAAQASAAAPWGGDSNPASTTLPMVLPLSTIAWARRRFSAVIGPTSALTVVRRTPASTKSATSLRRRC